MPETFALRRHGPEDYDRYLVPTFFRPCANELLAFAPPTAGERVLDLATGTGVIARLVASRLGPQGSVTALDVNPHMIDYARTVPTPLGTSVTWLTASAEAIPLPKRSVDAVYCQQGLQFFADQQAALVEAHRVLVPGGHVAIASWRSLRHNCAFADLVSVLPRHLPPTSVAALEAPFAGPDAAELRDRLAASGFDRIHLLIKVVLVRFGSTRELFEAEVRGSPLAETVGALDLNARENLAIEVDDALAAHTDDEGVLLPMQTWLVRARRQGPS